MHCRRAAALANETFIGAERDEMRANLLAAAQDKKLVYLDGPQLDVFVADGSSEASPFDLEALDDGL